MNPMVVRRVLGLIWPVLVPMALAVIALQAGWARGLRGEGPLAWLVLGAALVFAWRFNRGRIVLAAATLGLAAWVTSHLVGEPVARAAALMCVPLNLAVWALVQERGLLTPVGCARWGLLAVQAIGVWTLL